MKLPRIVNIDDSAVVSKACAVLEAGGVVMHPTETCYGFAVDVFNKDAVEKLYRMKGRNFTNPLSILVNGFDMANEYGIFSDKAFALARDFWPGALSLVIPRRDKLPKWFNNGNDYVSFRASSLTFCEKMVEKFGRPVTTTSANVSGCEPLYNIDLSSFGDLAGLIDLVVDGGELTLNSPSTVAKIVGDMVEVLRQGDVEV